MLSHVPSLRSRPHFVLLLVASLSYLLGMGLSSQSAEGLPGPGIEAPPPTAYALELRRKAASRSSGDLEQVEQGLTSEQGLSKLNTEQEYAQLPAAQLAVHAVLDRLARNEAPRAREIIGRLCNSPVFLAQATRVESLLQVLPSVRPIPPEALTLLRQASELDSDNQELAIRTLIEIGSKPALDLFATRAADPGVDPVLVQGWMRDPLLRRRRDPAVLAMCLDLLKRPDFASELKNSLVEVLFDYRPRDWYLSPEADAGAVPKPPPANQVSAEASTLLEEIATFIGSDPSISETNKALAARAVRGG
jgi:hypothetical protein